MARFEPLCQGFGLEAHDVDIAGPLPADAFAEIEESFFRGQVLVLRGQSLTPAQFLAFARRFGPPEPHVRTILIPSDYASRRSSGALARTIAGMIGSSADCQLTVNAARKSAVALRPIVPGSRRDVLMES